MTQPLASTHEVLILQHPQEKREALSTAPLLETSLAKATRRVGLSWPNFKKALGRDDATPSQWIVLYLGTKKQSLPLSREERDRARKEGRPLLFFFTRKGELRAPTEEDLAAIRGVVVLDGTWAQAKTLWWRNAWLLKLKRAMVIAPEASLYGDARKEPRPECVSTLESVAWTLSALGEPTGIRTGLMERFRDFLSAQSAGRK